MNWPRTWNDLSWMKSVNCRSILQAKLLTVLEDRRFERVGDSRSREIDLRIISATNSDLEAKINAGQFRKDLYYRLNLISIHVPPLRQRIEDIPVLLKKLTLDEAQRMNRPCPHLHG